MAENLQQLRRRHQALAARLGQVGFAVSGSLTRRYTRCGKPGCRCQADPPQMHGPYYQLTRKVRQDRSITRTLTAEEAERLRPLLAAQRRLASHRRTRRHARIEIATQLAPPGRQAHPTGR